MLVFVGVRKLTPTYELTSYGGSSSPQHDNNGNYTSPTGYGTLVWDAENRLVQAGTGSSQTKFSYDGLSRRRSATSYNNGTITNNVNYLWCDDSLCQKRQANSTSVMANYLVEGESYPNWLNAYYAVDHLGTPRDILNVATGQTLRAGDYTPFGGAEASAVNGLYSTEFGFAGMQIFPFTSGNVDYLTKYRLYKPGFGRWLSRDPIAEAGGINLYGYVEGNPVNWVDPLGLAPGDSYPNQNAAGCAAVCDINPQSIAENIEYGGSIYKLPDGSYSYTAPERGGEQSSDYDQNPPGEWTAIYHTHGGYDPSIASSPWGDRNTQFSDFPPDRNNPFRSGDIPTSDRINKPNYMADPKNTVHKYDPNDPNDPKRKKRGRKGEKLGKCK